MQKKLILFIIIFNFSCSYKPNAKGALDEINIIISERDRLISLEVINNYFNKFKYRTPQIENEFKTNYFTFLELDEIKNKYNLLFISLEHPLDSTGDYFISEVFKKINGFENKSIFSVNSHYANNQRSIFIRSKDLSALYNTFSNDGDWIINEYKNNVNKNLSNYIFSNGYNSKLSDIVQLYFKSDIKLQPDFKIIKEQEEVPFLWLGRGVPFRWLTIHKSNKNYYNNSKMAWERLVDDLSILMPDISINKNFRKIEIEEVLNKKTKVMRGLYDHKSSQTGGPFFFYLFDNKNSEITLVGGFVNNPGKEKLILIKQLEIIAKTYKIK
tara:strand:+ start:710 stop:1690 length:981 start_codon:yes stop_codon:yes gene_type:complete